TYQGIIQRPVVSLAAIATPPHPRLLLRLRQRSEEHTSELQSLTNLVCRLLLEKKKTLTQRISTERSRKELVTLRVHHSSLPHLPTSRSRPCVPSPHLPHSSLPASFFF